jgi:hypothetical protein
MKDGWIKVFRHIEESELWFCEPFSKAQAWIDIILIANHKKSMFFVRGNKVEVERGQFAYSEETLAKRWRWSRVKIRNFLNWLEKRSQIVQQKNRLLSIYTLVNYEHYQSDDTTDSTTEKQQKNIYKNDKNVKNIYNNIIHEDKPRVDPKVVEPQKTPEPAKRPPLEKQSYIQRIGFHYEDACGTKITNWGKQAKAISNMIRAGFTEDQVNRCVTYMATKHPFYTDKGFDLTTVSNEIVRLKAQERTTYGMDETQGKTQSA